MYWLLPIEELHGKRNSSSSHLSPQSFKWERGVLYEWGLIASLLVVALSIPYWRIVTCGQFPIT